MKKERQKNQEMQPVGSRVTMSDQHEARFARSRVKN